MIRKFQFFLFLLLPLSIFAQYDIEKAYWNDNKSMPYENVIDFYKKAAEKNDAITLHKGGTTDVGEDMFYITINGDKNNEENIRLLINNGIHPGEPCGVDASIDLVNDFLKGEFKIPKGVSVSIIPMYNIGGALRRGCCTRANQNGPEMHGFRGNAQNLDLNRDFIKMDSENAFSFAATFQAISPHIIVDTHTSNGADYTYTMTYLPQQKDVINPKLKSTQLQLDQAMYAYMEKNNSPMIPYVHSKGQTPFSGIQAYYDSPRYTTGYAASFNCIGFTSEAHMLKPYGDRVEATRLLLNGVINYAGAQKEPILQAIEFANQNDLNTQIWPTAFKLDTNQYSEIEFKGFEVEHFTSPITGKKTYRYNNEKVRKETIKYFDTYVPEDSIDLPEFYVLKKGWNKVLKRLETNKIKWRKLTQDTVIKVVSTLFDMKYDKSRLYEGHYYHKDCNFTKKTKNITLSVGDVLIPVNQKNKRFLVAVLEPRMIDSYWRWNFFDAAMQRKEYFSAYVFEETAQQLLEEDPELQKKWENFKDKNDITQMSHWSLLYFLYQHSPNAEGTAFEYPVYSIY